MRIAMSDGTDRRVPAPSRWGPVMEHAEHAEHAEEIDRLIARHVGFAMGAAALPVPLADIATVAAVQVALAGELARRYGVEAERARLRAAALALAGATAARVGASALKALPGVGFWLGGAAQVSLAGAATYALGHALREHFEASGSLAGPDLGALRERYAAYVERGRALARELRDVRFDDELDERSEALERLARLLRAGVLTEREYRRLVEPPTGDPLATD
jgi:uncharacterized protein (DUF697 family)